MIKEVYKTFISFLSFTNGFWHNDTKILKLILMWTQSFKVKYQGSHFYRDRPMYIIYIFLYVQSHIYVTVLRGGHVSPSQWQRPPLYWKITWMKVQRVLKWHDFWKQEYQLYKIITFKVHVISLWLSLFEKLF